MESSCLLSHIWDGFLKVQEVLVASLTSPCTEDGAPLGSGLQLHNLISFLEYPFHFLLPQGLCTCCFFCLENSSTWYHPLFARLPCSAFCSQLRITSLVSVAWTGSRSLQAISMAPGTFAREV